MPPVSSDKDSLFVTEYKNLSDRAGALGGTEYTFVTERNMLSTGNNKRARIDADADPPLAAAGPDPMDIDEASIRPDEVRSEAYPGQAAEDARKRRLQEYQRRLEEHVEVTSSFHSSAEALIAIQRNYLHNDSSDVIISREEQQKKSQLLWRHLKRNFGNNEVDARIWICEVAEKLFNEQKA